MILAAAFSLHEYHVKTRKSLFQKQESLFRFVDFAVYGLFSRDLFALLRLVLGLRMSQWVGRKNQFLGMLDMCTSVNRSLDGVCDNRLKKCLIAEKEKEDIEDHAFDVEFEKSLDQFIACETCKYCFGLCFAGFLAVVLSAGLLKGVLVYSNGGEKLQVFCNEREWVVVVEGAVVVTGAFLGFLWVLWRKNMAASYTGGQDQSEMKKGYDSTGASKSLSSKQQFMAYVFNNIRVPFNAIVLGLGHLKAAGDREIASTDIKGKMDLVKLMLDCAETMTNVLDDVAELGQRENGSMDLHNEEFDLLAVLKFLIGGLKELLSHKQIIFNMNMEPMVENLLTRYHVLGDKRRVVQTLGFFLSNAVKFTPYAGRLELEVRCEEVLRSRADDGQWPFHLQKDVLDANNKVAKIVISVKDFAAGMPSCHWSELCELYSLQSGSDSTWENSGLGLNMAKRFSERVGGYIGLRTSDGNETTFCLSIPYPLVQVNNHPEITSEEKISPVSGRSLCSIQDDAIDLSPVSVSHRRVLLVEDTEINRIILRKVLENLNLHCEEAENGKVAVDYFKQGRTYDLVLMDKEMPVMDGHEATRQLRTMGVKTPIVALTGNALQSDKDLFFEAGVDDFQTKPISRDRLVQLLARFGVESCGKGRVGIEQES